MGEEAKIYVVYGVTGEYEEACEWPVAAATDLAQAETLCGRLNQAASSLDSAERSGSFGLEERGRLIERLIAAGDPHPKVDYTGTVYRIYTVPLLSTVKV